MSKHLSPPPKRSSNPASVKFTINAELFPEWALPSTLRIVESRVRSRTTVSGMNMKASIVDEGEDRG